MDASSSIIAESGLPLPPPLSAASLKKQVFQREARLRRRKFAAPVVEQVLRYGAYVGSVIHCYRHLERGMALGRELISQCERQGGSFPSGTVIIADSLGRSKGRFDRVWHAPPGGLWLTVIVVNTLLPRYGTLYSLAAGVAACETARHFQIDARLKWVNDLLADGRKLGGILVESFVGPRYGEEYVLIGIGINVNNCRFPAGLPAVAMAELVGRRLTVPRVAAVLLGKMVWNIGLLHYEEACRLDRDDGAEGRADDHQLLTAWRDLSDTIGRRVRFGFDVVRAPQYDAVVRGIDAAGQLLMERIEDGRLVTERSGELLYL